MSKKRACRGGAKTTGEILMRQTRILKNTKMLLWAGLLGIAGTFTSVAAGEDKLGAQALADEAKHLMDSGKTAEACAKLEASLELDSTFTTLMSLGQCYEKVGRLASAYLTYRSAESEATASDQAKRAKTAHDRAEKVVPKMSRLTIRVTPEAAVKGLTVTRNGMNVAQSIWGTPIPVDPGAHDIVAQVGKKKWNQRVDVGGNAAQVYIDIPAFAPQPAPTAVAVVPVAPKAAAPIAARPVAPRPTAAPVAPRPVASVAPPAPKTVAPVATAAPRVAAAPPPAVVAKPVAAPKVAAVAPLPAAPKPVAVAPAPPPAPKAIAAAPPKPVAPVAKPAPVAAPVAAPKPAPVAAAKPPETQVSPKATETAPPEPTTPSERGFFTQQNIGIGVASLGVVGVGLGTYFVLRSNSKENTASAHCPNNVCDPTGFDANDAALSAKKAATWSYIAGGVLMAGGVVLILTEPKHDQVGQLRLHPFVGQNAASLALTGRF